MWLMVPCPPIPSLTLCRNSQASNYSQNLTAGRRGAHIRGGTSPCKPMTVKRGMPAVGEGSWSGIHELRAGEYLCGCAMRRATVRSSSYLTRRLAWTFAASYRQMARLLIQLEFSAGAFLKSAIALTVDAAFEAAGSTETRNGVQSVALPGLRTRHYRESWPGPPHDGVTVYRPPCDWSLWATTPRSAGRFRSASEGARILRSALEVAWNILGGRPQADPVHSVRIA